MIKTPKSNKFGWNSRRILGCALWWNYDLTYGSAWTWNHLKKKGRFYGITIGQCCIGITWFRKEKNTY